ncbi:mediator of RNA polymerase II transcription subunit 7 [Anastrepha obliqua]|uniref:mediator of RNA polymerase II transcription subunit 7 n=1 Tax=Anastrepha ludens TaxID=28586 RepID=UPI0023B0933A|nr:mediator of RNA polymerase II transcription subunit 7 [Anastrepha ludens]XP_053948462.1 mediator of RNA polymerase II transcription subunit 7 [Anastrepha ludens]XP_054744137.1 mediator of RNA polymerase II transcription subunit 7 [Anastrepha obliqua]XP_054744147.1 mediator of RNA polymerase II transcription subunit 7 [Anastrepha obliqua]
MANQESQVMSLPLPPTQYINLFSEENIRRNRAPRPPPPIQDSYSMFGIQYNNEEMIRSLESQNIKRLIPLHFDRRKELKKLNHSLFVNFLDLIDLLIQYPDSPRRTEKIDDLSLLFVHMHHLLNEFRPHQARETLRVMMEMQKRQRVETATRFQKHLERVRDIVNTAFADLPEIRNDDRDNDENVKMEIDTQEFNTNNRSDQLDRIMCKIIDGMD